MKQLFLNTHLYLKCKCSVFLLLIALSIEKNKNYKKITIEKKVITTHLYDNILGK